MQVTRIAKIKNHRLFKDFQWPCELHDFGKMNLMFGWNGSGKTTISNLFRSMEKHQAISEGDVDFLIDGRTVAGANLASGIALPSVRVFNREFVAASVFASDSAAISPIFFLGEDSITKQKEVEVLRDQLVAARGKTTATQARLVATEGALDVFCIEQGKAIKELLSSSGLNPYNNYDKRAFRRTCDELSKGKPTSKLLTDDQKNTLKRQKDDVPKEKLSPVSVAFPDLAAYSAKVRTLLEKTVISETLDELVADSGVAEWVRNGIPHHAGTHAGTTCRFCGQRMPPDRLARLERHFNDQYNRLLVEIADLASSLRSGREAGESAVCPAKAALYDDLAGAYQASVDSLTGYRRGVIAYLADLEYILEEKHTKPFDKMSLERSKAPVSPPDEGVGIALLSAVNVLIGRHNSRTGQFQQSVAAARKQLEECLVAEALDKVTESKRAVEDAQAELDSLSRVEKEISVKIANLERDIVEHRKPAEELNRELSSYLGQKELSFEVKEGGYTVARNGKPAEGLSEGEKTAIAFLYFLKSLQDRAFDLGQGVVVVDDPVSSLDATALYCAFGYMKERTKAAGQLFVLTHNASFFRQVKNWFNHQPSQRSSHPERRPARFFMVSAFNTAGGRIATLTRLDPLLHQYESDYQYLFKVVRDEAGRKPEERSLESYYGLPNLARRLIEAFLAFRYPGQKDQLEEQMNLVAFDGAKKARILRFLNTHSHAAKVSDAEHDMSILGETPQVLKDLLELIKSEDPRHFDQMAGVAARDGAEG